MGIICSKLKRKTYRVLASLLLLLVFVTGQAIVYGHTHHINADHMHLSGKKVNTDSRCQICDQNAHVHLYLDLPPEFFFQLSYTNTTFFFVAAYQSIKLLLSGNRGPPVV